MITFVKFIVVGLINTALDLAVLNGLIFFFTMGVEGEWYVLFKSISFLAAVTNSYFLNKYWVFGKGFTRTVQEPALFFAISFIGFALNVTVSSLVFFAISGIAIVSQTLAANIGAIAGTLTVLIWNFSGYKYLVFKTHHE